MKENTELQGNTQRSHPGTIPNLVTILYNTYTQSHDRKKITINFTCKDRQFTSGSDSVQAAESATDTEEEEKNEI